jgi:hypothetical protein
MRAIEMARRSRRRDRQRASFLRDVIGLAGARGLRSAYIPGSRTPETPHVHVQEEI